MENHKPIPLLFVFLVLYCLILPLTQSQLLPITNVHPRGGDIDQMHNTYIVRVKKPTSLTSVSDLRRWHESFLPNTTLGSGEPRLVYSYRKVISGFAAKLTAEEAIAMQARPGVLNVQQEEVSQIQTTYTPQLLGLSQQWGGGAWWSAGLGEGIVIGVIDTGITPAHPSFSDDGMPPPPVTWKGSCISTSGVTCNNKIIGAAAFNGTIVADAIDTEGHGTHVAGTAAGNFVDNANVLGTASGTAAGMAPRAHLAIYKVCYEKIGCPGSNLLAAIDQAIVDGVDLLSISIGSNTSFPFYSDPVAQGALAALSYGIMTVTSAGNQGPNYGTLSHDAPWVTAVGASATDRRITAIVKLGDGREFPGESAFQPGNFDSSRMFPIAFPGEFGDENATICMPGSLDFIDVRGKIVLCDAGGINPVDKGIVVYNAGGVAMILMNSGRQGYTTSPDAHVLPVANVAYRDGSDVATYYYSLTNGATSAATATIIFGGTTFGNRPSPAVGSFSSRGPATKNGGILKPDLVAPGVNILAAWPYGVGRNPSPFATSTFNFLSGTSMAAPHVSGIAALIMHKHPSWPPAVVQSAIITTAQDRNIYGELIADQLANNIASIFATGAGQVNPRAALDPGLVYNIKPNEYVGYLCGIGYADYELEWLYSFPVTCAGKKAINPWMLNYPTIQVSLPRTGGTVRIRRTATNVGDPWSVYHASITEPEGVSVYLSTYSLQFSRLLQEKSYDVILSISPTGPGRRRYSSGKIEWISYNHVVKSTIAVIFT